MKLPHPQKIPPHRTGCFLAAYWLLLLFCYFITQKWPNATNQYKTVVKAVKKPSLAKSGPKWPNMEKRPKISETWQKKSGQRGQIWPEMAKKMPNLANKKARNSQKRLKWPKWLQMSHSSQKKKTASLCIALNHRRCLAAETAQNWFTSQREIHKQNNRKIITFSP